MMLFGIYAKNNNTSAASNDYKVTNTGTIEVKKSVSKTAIGIYADKSTVLPKDGTIKNRRKSSRKFMQKIPLLGLLEII